MTMSNTTANGKGRRMLDEETKCMNSPLLGSSMPGLLVVSFDAFFVLHPNAITC